MHSRTLKKRTLINIGLILIAICVTGCANSDAPATKKKDKQAAIPVEVAPIKVETIQLRRSFSGTLEATTQFEVSPKTSGRIQQVHVDLADPVTHNQLVAELDDEEFRQEVNQAQANLAVAEANLIEATSNLKIAEREATRTDELAKVKLTTEAEVDESKARLSARQAALAVAKAQVNRSNAALAAAKVRLGYTKIRASCPDTDTCFVARRHKDVGATLSSNEPLLTLVSLRPMIAVVYVTEKDYGLLKIGQTTTIRTDAYPDRFFEGKVARISPVFNRDSRQARIEIEVDNADLELKPGMFIQAQVLIQQDENATTIPFSALVKNDDGTGVYVYDQNTQTVNWQTVTPGIQDGNRLQISEQLSGTVVTLGQQLLKSGTSVVIPSNDR